MLEDTTFIIPLRIDTDDRYRNVKIVTNFLSSNFNCKVLVKECDMIQRFDPRDIEADNVTYVYEKSLNPFFHKTKVLNDMILMSDTDIVVQYDTDVILPNSSYLLAAEMIRSGYDAVYPFINGYFSCKKVHLDKNSEYEFLKSFDIDILERCSEIFSMSNNNGYAHFGFCTFYNKASYINGFMENEDFCSYGPEDQEIYHRFVKLGMSVGRVDNFVYHIEHDRTNFSPENSEAYLRNMELYDRIMSMSESELVSYYSSNEYYLGRMRQLGRLDEDK